MYAYINMMNLMMACIILNSCSIPHNSSETRKKVFEGTCDSVCVKVEAPEQFRGNTFQVNYKFTNLTDGAKTIAMRGCSLNPPPNITFESGLSIEEDIPACTENNELENIVIAPKETVELSHYFTLKTTEKGLITVETNFIDNSKFSWDDFLAEDYDNMLIGSVIFQTQKY